MRSSNYLVCGSLIELWFKGQGLRDYLMKKASVVGLPSDLDSVHDQTFVRNIREEYY